MKKEIKKTDIGNKESDHFTAMVCCSQDRVYMAKTIQTGGAGWVPARGV